jgi:hypothetical protein
MKRTATDIWLIFDQGNPRPSFRARFDDSENALGSEHLLRVAGSENCYRGSTPDGTWPVWLTFSRLADKRPQHLNEKLGVCEIIRISATQFVDPMASVFTQSRSYAEAEWRSHPTTDIEMSALTSENEDVQ